MTYREIAEILLRTIGITSLDPAENRDVNLQHGLDTDRDIADVAACITGAIQELYTLCPSSLLERQVGGVLRAPASVTLTATQYSNTISALTTYGAWMLGCTIRIEGDNLDNRIISSTELLRPYTGTGGSVTATVYADCMPMSATYAAVIAPVTLLGRKKLHVANSQEEFLNLHQQDPRHLYETGSSSIYNKCIGEPCVAMADFEASTTAQPSLYVRFNPMPGEVYAVTCTARLAPPTVTSANIWTEGSPTVDPGVSIYLPLPEGVLLPFCLQRWTGHSSFSPSGQQLAEINRQYQIAKQVMQKRPAQYADNRAIHLP
jgi:hypothetical protein